MKVTKKDVERLLCKAFDACIGDVGSTQEEFAEKLAVTARENIKIAYPDIDENDIDTSANYDGNWNIFATINIGEDEQLEASMIWKQIVSSGL